MSATFGKIGARDLVWKPPYDAEVEYIESQDADRKVGQAIVTGGSSEDIGCGDTTRRLFTGDVGCVRCYNRVLSQAEIAYNCAIDKIRFNLP